MLTYKILNNEANWKLWKTSTLYLKVFSLIIKTQAHNVRYINNNHLMLVINTHSSLSKL